jgi:hypothetical protein
LKINRDNWQRDFENELDKAERRQLSKVKRYYKTEYKKGVESFVSEGQTNFQLLFSESDLSKTYRDLYTDIGLQFAKWYANNFDKYITKGVEAGQFVDQWINSFSSFGSAVAAQRVTLVSGTAKETLIKITQRFMSDPEFMTLGNTEKARILNNQFDNYARYQAARLVRTEATAAANFATMQSATTIFPGAQMMKEWIASFDDRTRSTHAEAGASDPVPYNDPFMVGGSFMMFPGDPSGPAAEVVNCRCSMAPFPKEGAQTVGEISDINLGLSGGSTTGFGISDVLSTVGSTVVSGVQSASDNIAKTMAEARRKLLGLFTDNNFKIDKLSMSRLLTLEQYNKRIAELERLFRLYNFDRKLNFERLINIKNKSGAKYYGRIVRGRSKSELWEINFGHQTDKLKVRTRGLFDDKFDNLRFKSAVDADKYLLSTLVHEMGHVLSRSGLIDERQFWIKISELKKDYTKNILKYREANNYKSFNEIFLGKYAMKNVDEFMAECWTEYQLHSNPSKYARLVGELIEEFYKK